MPPRIATKPEGAELRAEPFVAWLSAEYDRILNAYETEFKDAGATERPLPPMQQLAQLIGWGATDAGARRAFRTRRGLRSLRIDGVSGDHPTETYPRTMIEDALDHAGVAVEDLYPELAIDVDVEPDAYCWACEDTVTPIDGTCPWCENTDLRPPQSKPPRARRRGWKRPDRAATGKLTDTHLRALHKAYVEQGVSVNDLAKQIWRRVGYKNYESCGRGIYKGWQRLELPARDRIEAVKMKCTIHGMAPKHGNRRREYRFYLRQKNGDIRPRCKGTLRGPGRSRQCERPAMKDSEYCQAHDPRLELGRQAHLARIRRLQPVKEMLPMAPFAAWLLELRADLGSMRNVSRLIGMDHSQCCRHARGQDTAGRPKDLIARETVERYATRADTTVEAIYVQAERRAA